MQSIVYCFIVVFGILSVCLNSAFTQETPTPSTIPDFTPTPTPTPTPIPILTPQAPTVVTGDATVNMDIGTVTLNGTVNAHGLTTTAWFQYGTSSGLYSGTSTTQNVEGVDDVVVNLDLSMGDLPIRTGSGYTYYYRIAAQNDAGTSYGNKKSFETGMHGDCFLCSISGYVTDAITKNGIGDAVVNIDSEIELTDINGFYYYADNEGSYSCEGVSHTITVSADNYISSTQTFTFDEITCFKEELSFELQPICEAKKITIFPRILKIEREQSREVTVTLEGDACIPEGQTVTATVSRAGKGRISISSTSEVTDANGQAVFTITAKKLGNARVVLKTGGLKKLLIVKVK